MQVLAKSQLKLSMCVYYYFLTTSTITTMPNNNSCFTVFVQDYMDEPVPEETLTHSHLS